jgi:CHASE2 domain-containing sensor protein
MGYRLFDGTALAHAWNIVGAVAMGALLVAVGWRWRGPVRWVIGWWLFEEVLVVVCSVAFIIKPWDVPAGMDMGSALIGFDLGRVSAVAMIGLLIYVLGFSRRTSV